MGHIITGALAGIAWALLYWLVSRYRTECRWNKLWRGSESRVRLLLALFWIVRAIPLVLLPSLAFGKWPYSAAAIWVVAEIAITIVRQETIRIRSNRIARQYNLVMSSGHRSEGKWELEKAQKGLAALGLVSLLFVPLFPALSVIPFAFAVVFVVTARKSVYKPVKTTFEMDDTLPLKCEIVSLGKSWGQEIKSIFVRARPHKGGTWMVPVGEQGQTTDTLVIPVENFLYLNSPAYTAVWARKAIVARPGSTAARSQAKGIAALCCLVAGCGLVMITIAALLNAMHLNSFMLFPVIVAAALFVSGARQVGYLLFPREKYRYAFEVWRGVAPDEHRTLQDYVDGIAEHHCWFNGIREPELVIHQLRQDRALTGTIRDEGFDSTTVFAAALQHLEVHFPAPGEPAPVSALTSAAV